MSRTAEKPHPSAFWAFSLAVYARAGVREACLSLQDSYGADVNVLLFCAWTGAERGASLSHAECVRAAEGTTDWRDHVVRPLRNVRRAIKARQDGIPDVGDPYGALKSAELEAEKTHQFMLASEFGGLGRPAPDNSAIELAAGNMMTYMAALGFADRPAMAEMVSVIADAAAGP